MHEKRDQFNFFEIVEGVLEFVFEVAWEIVANFLWNIICAIASWMAELLNF